MGYGATSQALCASSPGRGATGESVAAVLDERSFCNRERLGSAVEIHGSNTNATTNEDRARRLAPDWACADSRAGPACQGASSLCRYSRHLPPAGRSLSYQESCRAQARLRGFVPPKIYSTNKSYLKRKLVSKLHKTFESFLEQENTRENLPKHPLQSGSFAVNCMYQKDGAAQSAPFQRMEQGIPAENLEEYGMLELLLGTIRRLCATGYQGIRVTSCGRVLHRP